jgi:hypothetical protein
MYLETNQEIQDVFDPCVLQPTSPQQAPRGLQLAAVGGRLPLRPSAAPRREQASQPAQQPWPRCTEKGCVFPSELAGGGECAYHHRQFLEPACFSSQQPTRLLLDHARFNTPVSAPDTSRSSDRRRLAAERAKFILEDGI